MKKILFSAAVALLIGGCGAKMTYQAQTGFLSDYAQLEQTSPSTRAFKSDAMKQYTKVRLAGVSVVQGTTTPTPEQEALYVKIKTYLEAGLKKALGENGTYTLVEASGDDVLELSYALSAVEVHFDDAQWNQFTAAPLGVDALSYSLYLSESIRIMLERRASHGDEVLGEYMEIVKDSPIVPVDDQLSFEGMKPALDAWLESALKGM